MYRLLTVMTAATAFLLGGCNIIYKQSIQQGNAIEEDELAELAIGMNKRQVSLIMGTPAVHDPFHNDRWDYLYTFRPRGNDGAKRLVTLYFENGVLAKIVDSQDFGEETAEADEED